MGPRGMRKGSGEGSIVRGPRRLYPSLNVVRTIKSRRLRWAGQVARMEERRPFKNLTGIPTGKRPLGRSRYQYEELG